MTHSFVFPGKSKIPSNTTANVDGEVICIPFGYFVLKIGLLVNSCFIHHVTPTVQTKLTLEQQIITYFVQFLTLMCSVTSL